MKKHFVICVDKRGYEASLEIRKLYEVLELTGWLKSIAK